MRLVLIFLLCGSYTQATENPLSLSKQKLGESPAGFKIIRVGPGKPGTAKVIRTAVPNATTGAMEEQRVLEVTGGDSNSSHYTLLLLEKPKQKDFVCSTRFKITNGTGVRAAGLVFRMQPNHKDYYLLAIKPLSKEAFWTVFKNNLPVKGFRYDDEQFTTPNDGWQSIKLTCENNNLKWTLNHRRDFVTYDPKKVPDYRVGTVGYWVRSDSQVQFAAPRINTLQEERKLQLVNLLLKITRDNTRVLSLQLAARPTAGAAPVVVASINPKEIGKPAHEVITKVLETRENFYGHNEKGVATVTVPVKDRNGDTVAVTRMRLRSKKENTERKDLNYGNTIAKQLQAEIPDLHFLFK